MTARRNERGSLSVFVFGVALVTFAVAGIAVDGTRAFLYRRTLQNHADAVALAAASELDKNAYYSSGGRDVRLDGPPANAIASRFISLRGLPARAAVAVSEDTVTVTVRGAVTTTFLGLVGVDEIPVAVSARAAPVPAERGP
ncbi:MAG: pilus assembly protein TadG-related protein [Actinomycetota bacterium]|nr:pilus assembly protein TadG-related protein [Actinomycetota bacterium]